MGDIETTRRQLLARLPAVGAAAALGAGIAISTNEAEAAGLVQQAPSTPLPQGVKSVRGSWFGVLTAGDGRTSRGLATFTPDGGWLPPIRGTPSPAGPRAAGTVRGTRTVPM